MIVKLQLSIREALTATGRIVCPVGGDAALEMCISSINTQYHQYYGKILSWPDLLTRQPGIRGMAIKTIRVGYRRGDSTNRRKVITGVICRPARVPSPGNSQIGYEDEPHCLTIQTERIATDGERWSSTHPPPWLNRLACWRRKFQI